MANNIQKTYGYSVNWLLTGKGIKKPMAYDNIMALMNQLSSNELQMVLDFAIRLGKEEKYHLKRSHKQAL